MDNFAATHLKTIIFRNFAKLQRQLVHIAGSASRAWAYLTFAISSPSIIAVTDRNHAPGRIIYLGACLIAAVRLAREEHWDNSPRVVSRIADAIQLAKRIYERMKSEFGLELGS
jgi:hypothetical protein